VLWPVGSASHLVCAATVDEPADLVAEAKSHGFVVSHAYAVITAKSHGRLGHTWPSCVGRKGDT
jgi:hypothetical protein